MRKGMFYGWEFWAGLAFCFRIGEIIDPEEFFGDFWTWPRASITLGLRCYCCY